MPVEHCMKIESDVITQKDDVRPEVRCHKTIDLPSTRSKSEIEGEKSQNFHGGAGRVVEHGIVTAVEPQYAGFVCRMG